MFLEFNFVTRIKLVIYLIYYNQAFTICLMKSLPKLAILITK